MSEVRRGPRQPAAGAAEHSSRESFEGGTQLHGGRWQRLALAPAMMRPCPALLMLAEPRANLDATAAAVFARHPSATQRVRREGGSTVLISHPFSTVQAADHIVAIARGRLVERRSHRQLMESGGPNAQLFRFQASGYAA